MHNLAQKLYSNNIDLWTASRQRVFVNETGCFFDSGEGSDVTYILPEDIFWVGQHSPWFKFEEVNTLEKVVNLFQKTEIDLKEAHKWMEPKNILRLMRNGPGIFLFPPEGVSGLAPGTNTYYTQRLTPEAEALSEDERQEALQLGGIYRKIKCIDMPLLMKKQNVLQELIRVFHEDFLNGDDKGPRYQIIHQGEHSFLYKNTQASFRPELIGADFMPEGGVTFKTVGSSAPTINTALSQARDLMFTISELPENIDLTELRAYLGDFLKPKVKEPKTVLHLEDWCICPSGPRRQDGDYSGEAYREDVLLPALRDFQKVYVDMNRIIPPGCSWLESCFGPLTNTYSVEDLEERLFILVDQKSQVRLAWCYIRGEKP
ncbi:MAG: STAS-like domain-containing protein [Desulfobulbaceae bacterium]|nr:STAS-like domain-containing protein [Desulfobulbaceae bacterium]